MKKISVGLLLFVLLFAAGCGRESSTESGIRLYYVNEAGNSLAYETLDIGEGTTWEEAQVLTADLQDDSLLPQDCSSVLYNSLQIESWRIEGKTIHIDLSGDYGSLSNSAKLLVVAGLVKTYTQIDGVEYVVLTIQGEPLLDAGGNEFGSMSADDFVIHSGNEINVYSKTEMTLYFADESGQLVPEGRNVYYSSNIPMEQLVVEELIKGPYDADHRAVLPPDLDFINVSTQEDICYVNFDENMSTLMQNYDVETALEAIVKSLDSVCGIKKVQFSVNGKTAVEIGGVSFGRIFEA